MDVKRLAHAARRRLARDLDRIPLAWLLAALAAIASVMTSVMIASTWHTTLAAYDQARMDRFGGAVSTQLAVLAVEPLIAGDRIQLGVLAQRMTNLPEIMTVAVRTIDDRTVAVAGEPRRQPQMHYTHSIEFEGAVAGYVQTGVDPASFRVGGAAVRLGLPALAMLLASLGLGYALGRHLESRAQRRSTPYVSTIGPNGLPTDDDEPVAAPDEDALNLLLVINLFNQTSLPADVRSEALARTSERAAQVAGRYRGHVEELPGTGALVVFPPQREPDFCFRAVCAALLCADVLAELNDGVFNGLEPRLVYRFGLHAARGVEAMPMETDADVGDDDADWPERVLRWRDTDAVGDATLLSAVASNGAVALSRDAFAQLADTDRCRWVWRDNPVLDTLVTAEGGSCAIVEDVTDEYRDMLDIEVELLMAPNPNC